LSIFDGLDDLDWKYIGATDPEAAIDYLLDQSEAITKRCWAVQAEALLAALRKALPKSIDVLVTPPADVADHFGIVMFVHGKCGERRLHVSKEILDNHYGGMTFIVDWCMNHAKELMR